MKWCEFRKLYASPEEPEKRIALLNDTAGLFFGLVQDIMWKDVLLHVARLTDPVEQGRRGEHKNLTILGLPEAVEDPELRSQVCARVEEARKRTGFARDWRNRRIAHRDLPLALGDTRAEALPSVSRAKIEEALESIRSVMNLLSCEYGEGYVAYELVGPPVGDADALVWYLSTAYQADQRRREQYRKGQ